MQNKFHNETCSTIGLQGFEPWTSPTRTARSTKLSHNPRKSVLLREEGKR
jgi:hypothetical protein